MLKQKTVYFREEDLPLWEAIENKAEWLHAHLRKNVYPVGPQDFARVTNNPNTVNEVIKTKADAEKAIAPIKKPPVTYTPKTNWGA